MEEVKKYSKYKFILFIIIFILSIFLSGFFTAKNVYAAGLYEDIQYTTLQQWQNAEKIPEQFLPPDLYKNKNVMVEVYRGSDNNQFNIYITDYETIIPFKKNVWNGVSFEYGYAVNKDYNLGRYKLLLRYTDETKQVIDYDNSEISFKESNDIVGDYKFIDNPKITYTGGSMWYKFRDENTIIYSSCDLMDTDGESFFFQRKAPTPKVIEGVITGMNLSLALRQVLFLVPVMMILVVGFLGLRKVLRILSEVLHQA